MVTERPSSHVPAERTDHYGAQIPSQSLTSLSWGRAVVLKENHSLRCQGHSWSYSEPKQAGCLSSSWGCFPRVMNSANQAALNIIIMKWMHLVSEGFIHWGNEKEVISLFADLLVGHLQNSHGARRLLTWAADRILSLIKRLRLPVGMPFFPFASFHCRKLWVEKSLPERKTPFTSRVA